MKIFVQTRRRTLLGLAVAAAMAPCAVWAADAASPDRPAPANSPEPGLPAALPESVGVDSTPLIRMSEWIRKDKLDVRSFLVVKDGKLIFERYGGGLDRAYNYELYSVTKTITSLVFGIRGGGRENQNQR